MSGADSAKLEKRFEFISLSGTEERTDPETLKRIHRHVQTEYRRRRGLDSRKTGQGQEVVVEGPAYPPPQSSSQALISSPRTLLSASRTDPFRSFAIDENPRAHRFWDHVYDGTCPKFRTLVAVGFVDLARETIALPQLLSASAWHLVHLQTSEADQGDDAYYSMVSQRSLQHRLESANCESEEVVVAVLAHAVYAILIARPDLFQVHMNGLRSIVDRRGHGNNADFVDALQLSLFWIEVNGRCRQDAVPSFPPPGRILASISTISPGDIDSTVVPSLELSSEIYNDLAVRVGTSKLRFLNTILERAAPTMDLWRDPMFSVIYIGPVLHEFLSMPRPNDPSDRWQPQRECFRLAGILYLLTIRAEYDFEPGSGMLYGIKLRSLLTTSGTLQSHGISSPILIWSLTLGACSSIILNELRGGFRKLLSQALQDNGIQTFTELIATIRAFVWSESVLSGYLRGLRADIALP